MSTVRGYLEKLALRETLYAAVFSPDGKKIVTGSEDKTTIVWIFKQLSVQLFFSLYKNPCFSMRKRKIQENC